MKQRRSGKKGAWHITGSCSACRNRWLERPVSTPLRCEDPKQLKALVSFLPGVELSGVKRADEGPSAPRGVCGVAENRCFHASRESAQNLYIDLQQRQRIAAAVLPPPQSHGVARSPLITALSSPSATSAASAADCRAMSTLWIE